MAGLVSMKITRTTEQYNDSSVAADRPEYPYGLCLSLDEDALGKLGVTDLPKVGGEVTITARACVTSVSSYENQDGGERRSVGLQITDLGIEGPEKSDAAAALYGG
jgi:hypothetical protein